MPKLFCLAACVLMALPSQAVGAELRADELRWIRAGLPVIGYARAQGLALDIVVQPGDEPDASPVAMGIREGRCKLVLSLRGNPGAATLADSIPATLFEAVAQAVIAHEVGHCWRWVRGAWNGVPAGIVDAPGGPEPDAELSRLQQAMRETRREEGYADLAGLAWTQRTRPADFTAVHAWFERFRVDDTGGRHHDTAAWLRLARDPAAFGAGIEVFESARRVWESGLSQATTPTAEPPLR